MKLIEKPWGYEKLIEVSDLYVVKELFMKSGHSCSLQYHNFKQETFYIVDGLMRFYIGESADNLQILELKPRDFYTIKKGLIHKMEAIQDCTYIESSTNHLDDVVRIQDNYGRV